jgi:predicted RNA-binding protein YlqC (UPF0109 family)
MRATKKELLKLDEMLHQAYATIACGIDPIENKELIARLGDNIRAIREYVKGEAK